MTFHLQTLVDTIAGHQQSVYILVFLLSLSESLPIVGAVIPGSALIIGISALVPSGAVELWPLLSWAVLGAVAGDGLSYWLGHHYHRQITVRWPFTRYPRLIPRGEAFFHRHGGKSVFLARFTPGVRAIIPLVAGIARMPVIRFYTVNILSAFAWAPLHILSGALVGASLTLAGAVAGRLTVFLILLFGALWLVAWATRFALRRGLPLLDVVQDRLWSWAQARESWISRQVITLLDPAKMEIRGLALAGALLIGGAWIFFGILEDLISGDPLVRANVAVYQFLQGLRTEWADRIMIALTELGDGAVTTLVTGIVFIWLAWRRAWRPALYWLGAVVFAALFTTVMKLTLQMARPVADLYSGWSAFSFPSGHTTVNTTLYGFLTLLIAREVGPRRRRAVIVGAVLMVVAIAFSRLYLGAHWLSDVAAGLAFGVAWVALLGIAYLRHSPPRLPITGLAIVFAVTLLLIGGLHIILRYPSDVQRYAIRQDTRSLTAAAWWNQAWQELPVRRIDLAGELEEPLALQWAGSLDELKGRLLKSGWRIPEAWTLNSTLIWLAPNPDPGKLPVLPRLQNGRSPALTLIYPQPDQGAFGARLVLRLWATGFTLLTAGDTSQPLWVGAVVEQQLERPYSVLTITDASADVNAPRNALAAALSVTRLAQRPNRISGNNWDGSILLARAGAVSIDVPAKP